MSVLPGDLKSLKKDIIDKLVQEDLATCPSNRGFVRENITYKVTENLEVMPSTTIRSIQVLNKLMVATLAHLESIDVVVSITQNDQSW
uniref:Uncharacterized protein n=1 Tax=Physcomitrium patens TaxID=3218 RepID=A0A7I4BLS4_PHYPA